MKASTISQARLQQVLAYCPNSGDFTWVSPTKYHPRMSGQKAGCSATGYIMIRVDGKKYHAHRLAWLYTYGSMPDGYIDHKDGNPFNNAISNLRIATVPQNLANACRKRGKTLPKGVRQNGNRFTARISKDGRLLTIGTFPTIDQAAEAYLAKAKEIYGSFARGS